MSKWYEVPYTLSRVAFIEVSDDQGKDHAIDAAYDSCIDFECDPGTDVDVGRVEQVDEDQAERFSAGTDRMIRLPEGEQ